MPQNIKITNTDVFNFINVDYYEIDGRCINIYTSGNKQKHQIVFESVESALNKWNKLNAYLKPKDLENETISPSEDENLIETFWILYEKRGSKRLAKEQFKKLTVREIKQLFESTPDYIKSRPEIKYRKHAERYLRDRDFENTNDIKRRIEENNKDKKEIKW